MYLWLVGPSFVIDIWAAQFFWPLNSRRVPTMAVKSIAKCDGTIANVVCVIAVNTVRESFDLESNKVACLWRRNFHSRVCRAIV